MAKTADCGREGRMALAELVARTRTVRRFKEEVPLDPAFLEQLVDLARLGGSARNAPALCYLPVIDPGLRAALFPLLAWAGYLPDWPGPAAGERPAAYIVCVLDRERQRGPETEAHFDLGISTQNLLLVAAGLAMLFLPGQGLLTVLIGVSVMDFPGKRGLLQRLVRGPKVQRTLNWIRRKRGKEPFAFAEAVHNA